MLYRIVLFVHLSAVLAAFAAAVLGHLVDSRIHRAADVGEIRGWLGSTREIAAVFPSAFLILIASGIYLVIESHAFWNAPWLDVSFAGLAMLMLNGALVIGGRQRALARQLSALAEKPFDATVARLVHDPVTRLARWINTTLTLGVVFVMVVKPPLGGALAAIGTALALGALLGFARRASPAGIAAMRTD